MEPSVQCIQWICQAPSPYNNHLFAALAREPEVKLHVHFVEARSTHRWIERLESEFQWRVFEPFCGFDIALLKRALATRCELYVIGGWANPTLILLPLLLFARRRRFVIWTDAPNLSKKRNPLKATFRRLWLKCLFAMSHRVMGTGPLALENLQRIGCSMRKLINFPCIIDLRPYQSGLKTRGANDIPVFLSSGRLVNSHKGYDLALRAFARLKEDCPAVTFRYRIAGEGPDMDQLRTLSRKLCIDDSVEFVGWLQPSELPDFYNGGDFFVHPAHFEPYGVVVVEAMAAGLIPIASDQTGAALDRIEPKVSGFLHKAGDSESLAHALREVVKLSPEQKNRMEVAARERGALWPTTRAIRTVKGLLAADSR
jgi:glycosyltransferase involved in cell wall biosynthesis